jgi:hypothetical protein
MQTCTRFIKLKESIRFQYRTEVMATISAGEVGSVSHIYDDHLSVTFESECIIPDDGLPAGGSIVDIPFELAEQLPELDKQEQDQAVRRLSSKPLPDLRTCN